MRRALTLLYAMGSFFVCSAVMAASFDCAKASTKVEHMICDNSKLSQLDSKLGQDYWEVLSKANEEQKRQLIADQKHWLKFTRNVCDKVTCLKHAYWSRQAALENYFEQRSPLYEHESDKADDIKHVLATSTLYPAYDTPFCHEIFDDLKQMNGIHFVDPVVQAQSYEDPALDPWKKQCRTAPPFNFGYWCDRNLRPTDAGDVLKVCNAGYGLPPFKLYELPPAVGSGEKRYYFYADERYGPINRDWEKPSLGGAGLAGFQQIDIAKCLSGGNQWEPGEKKKSSWNGTYIDAGQGGRNGKNYNSIIEYRNEYYFFILHRIHGNYWLNIEPVTRVIPLPVCSWTPIKDH